MAINIAQSQSAPEITVDLKRFKGRGVQPRSQFADEVRGHLIEIKLRAGEYQVTRNNKPVIGPDGKPLVRPNSAVAKWVDDDGQQVLTSWPARYDDQHHVLLWDAFDQSIDLSVDYLHFKKESSNGRTWYTLERIEVATQTETQPDDSWEDYYC